MATTSEARELSYDVAKRINKEARENPDSLYRGKFVGLVNGEIVVVASNLDDCMAQLRKIEPDSRKLFWLEAGIDYDEVQEIWVTN